MAQFIRDLKKLRRLGFRIDEEDITEADDILGGVMVRYIGMQNAGENPDKMKLLAEVPKEFRQDAFLLMNRIDRIRILRQVQQGTQKPSMRLPDGLRDMFEHDIEELDRLGLLDEVETESDGTMADLIDVYLQRLDSGEAPNKAELVASLPEELRKEAIRQLNFIDLIRAQQQTASDEGNCQ